MHFYIHAARLRTQVYVIISNYAIRNLWNVISKQKCKHNKNYVKDLERETLSKTSSVPDKAVSHNSPSVY